MYSILSAYHSLQLCPPPVWTNAKWWRRVADVQVTGEKKSLKSEDQRKQNKNTSIAKFLTDFPGPIPVSVCPNGKIDDVIEAYLISEAVLKEIHTVKDWIQTVHNHKVDLSTNITIIKKALRMGTVKSIMDQEKLTRSYSTQELYQMVTAYKNQNNSKKRTREHKKYSKKASKLTKIA